MARHDYIPQGDAEFDAWQASFLDYAAKHANALGLSTETLEDLHQLSKDWDIDYAAATSARAAWQSAVAEKQDKRRELVAALRRAAAQLRGAPTVDDAQRAALGLTIPDTTPTAARAPQTAPRVAIDASQRLSHRLSFSDESSPTRRAKPAGVHGAEIWVALRSPGEPAPTNIDGFQFRGTATRSPHAVSFEMPAGSAAGGGVNAVRATRGANGRANDASSATNGANNSTGVANGGRDGAVGATGSSLPPVGGMTAHYQLRWVNPRGEHGPWSAVVSATVLG